MGESYKPEKAKEINIDGERIFLSKSKFFGWNVVYPTKIDGKLNIKHLITGRSWWNLIIVSIVVLILLGAINEYVTILKTANQCLLEKDILNQITMVKLIP